MSVTIDQVIPLLKRHVSVPVYNSFVPEAVSGTAVAVYNVTNSRKRTLDGTQVSKVSYWRVVLVSANPREIPEISRQLEAMDMKSDGTFQRIYTELVNSEALEAGSLIQRTFFDLTLYER